LTGWDKYLTAAVNIWLRWTIYLFAAVKYLSPPVKYFTKKSQLFSRLPSKNYTGTTEVFLDLNKFQSWNLLIQWFFFLNLYNMASLFRMRSILAFSWLYLTVAIKHLTVAVKYLTEQIFVHMSQIICPYGPNEKTMFYHICPFETNIDW
jgi:hypothetical protein